MTIDTQAFASARTTPLSVVVHAELSPKHLARIQAVSDQIQLITRRELDAHPELLDQAEVLFAQQLAPARIAAAPRLRWVQTFGAGVEWLLTPELIARSDLQVTNASGIHAQPIAEHVFGLILAFARKLDKAFAQQPEQTWRQAELSSGLRTLDGATLGILGLGEIGRRIAQIGKAFGMRVIGSRRSAGQVAGVDRMLRPDQLSELLAESDYLVNALPFTADTRHLLGAPELQLLKRDAVLINIGRGGTIDTDALVTALREQRLGGALLDVTDPEPLPREHPLWALPNVLITPHYSGAHPGYIQRVTSIFVDNLRRYLAGESLINLVDKAAGY